MAPIAVMRWGRSATMRLVVRIILRRSLLLVSGGCGLSRKPVAKPTYRWLMIIAVDVQWRSLPPWPTTLGTTWWMRKARELSRRPRGALGRWMCVRLPRAASRLRIWTTFLAIWKASPTSGAEFTGVTALELCLGSLVLSLDLIRGVVVLPRETSVKRSRGLGSSLVWVALERCQWAGLMEGLTAGTPLVRCRPERTSRWEAAAATGSSAVMLLVPLTRHLPTMLTCQLSSSHRSRCRRWRA